MTQPNILVIMGDHFRHDAMGWKGNPLAHTPNLDRLASESVRFTDCFCQSPVCSPARHALNTGQYCHKNGVCANGDIPHEGMFTLAHALNPHGYRCFHRGHMHWQGEIDNGYEPKTGEAWIGAKEFAGTLSPEARRRRKSESDTPIRRTTGGPSPRKENEYNGHYVMTKTIEDINAAVSEDKPFLAWASFSEPHPPFYPPKKYYEMIDQSKIVLPEYLPEGAPEPHPSMVNRRQEWAHLTEVEIKQIIAGYYGLVAMLDMYVGNILDELDNLGVADNTIVIWSSDHGDQLWEHEMFLKFQMRESSIHIPLMIRVPGGSAGERDVLAEHVDVYPTVCELAGIDIPDSVQGRSLLPLLGKDEKPDGWREAVFSEMGTCDFPHVQKMIRTKEWKLTTFDDEPGELFNLKDDIQEHYNLIDDDNYTDVKTDLKEKLDDWYQATS